MLNPSRESAVILTIDDEPEVLGGLTRMLTNAGYSVHCAMNADAALKAAIDTHPDLIISDINLDGQSGLALCEQLRKQANLGHTPVIFLSGAQIPDIIRRAHAAGGSYYLRKPYDPQVLMELVDKALWMPHLVEHRMSTV